MYFNIFPLSAEQSVGMTDRVMTDSRYNGMRYSKVRLYKFLHEKKENSTPGASVFTDYQHRRATTIIM